jgi:hypothetical protein
MKTPRLFGSTSSSAEKKRSLKKGPKCSCCRTSQSSTRRRIREVCGRRGRLATLRFSQLSVSPSSPLTSRADLTLGFPFLFLFCVLCAIVRRSIQPIGSRSSTTWPWHARSSNMPTLPNVRSRRRRLALSWGRTARCGRARVRSGFGVRSCAVGSKPV